MLLLGLTELRKAAAVLQLCAMAATVDKAESRLSISEVPQEISRIFFGEPQPRYF